MTVVRDKVAIVKVDVTSTNNIVSKLGKHDETQRPRLEWQLHVKKKSKATCVNHCQGWPCRKIGYENSY